MEWLKSTKLLLSAAALSLTFIGLVFDKLDGPSFAAVNVGVVGAYMGTKLMQYKAGK